MSNIFMLLYAFYYEAKPPCPLPFDVLTVGRIGNLREKEITIIHYTQIFCFLGASVKGKVGNGVTVLETPDERRGNRVFRE
jgi:hypothetical protein